MNLYDNWGTTLLNIVPKDLYLPGTYKFEYTIAENYVSDIYVYQLKADSSKSLTGNIMYIDFRGSGKSSDYVKITYYDTVTTPVIDTVKITLIDKVTVYDTTKIVILDTLNCLKSITRLDNYESFPISENISFHDNLTIDFNGADNLVLYDLSGKFIRKMIVTGNEISLQSLTNGTYIGLFYLEDEILKTVRLIKN